MRRETPDTTLSSNTGRGLLTDIQMVISFLPLVRYLSLPGNGMECGYCHLRSEENIASLSLSFLRYFLVMCTHRQVTGNIYHRE